MLRGGSRTYEGEGRGAVALATSELALDRHGTKATGKAAGLIEALIKRVLLESSVNICIPA